VQRRDGNGNPIESKVAFNLDQFLDLLGDAIRNLNVSGRGPVRLLIFDPLISFFGEKDYNSSQDASEMMARFKAWRQRGPSLQTKVKGACFLF
jgi:hypothetical protein